MKFLPMYPCRIDHLISFTCLLAMALVQEDYQTILFISEHNEAEMN